MVMFVLINKPTNQQRTRIQLLVCIRFINVEKKLHFRHLCK